MPDIPMWSLVMFDLPTQTKEQKRAYTTFRNFLLDEGFVRVQFSVYVFFSPSGILSTRKVSNLKKALPSQGKIQVLHVTDKQWASAVRFFNSKEEKPENAPTQLAFF